MEWLKCYIIEAVSPANNKLTWIESRAHAHNGIYAQEQEVSVKMTGKLKHIS